MLTGPLIISRFKNGVVTPYVLKIDTKHRELTEDLITLFKESINFSRTEIEEEVKSLYSRKVNQKVIQGLTKLLMNRSEFSDALHGDPVLNRETVFFEAAKYWRNNAETTLSIKHHKKRILENLGQFNEATYNETEGWLYGDVTANQKLISFQDLSQDSLIHRYNIAQVQGLLLNAQTLSIRINVEHDSSFRQLFRILKFYQLMFEVQEADEKWLSVSIDGPGAVLENARSYGFEMANFFPALLLIKSPWSMNATVKMSGRRRRFNLTLGNDNPYQSHYKETGIWKSERVLAIMDRFNDKYAEKWYAESENRIVPLRDNRLLIPDLIFKEKGNSNREVLLEWIQYPSEAKLKWLKKIANELPENYIVAVKGKNEKTRSLEKKLKTNVLLFTKDLTAPAIQKRLKEL